MTTEQEVKTPQQPLAEVLSPKRKRKYKYKKTSKRGRPSSIDRINLDKIKKLALAGWTDKEIANFFDITVTALDIYKSKHESFFKSLKEWKHEADIKVEKSLYKIALGYKYDEVTYEQSKIGSLGVKLSNDEIEQVKSVPSTKTKIVTKAVVPNVIAQIFWLKNRKPNEWREKHEFNGNINLTIEDFLKHNANGHREPSRISAN